MNIRSVLSLIIISGICGCGDSSSKKTESTPTPMLVSDQVLSSKDNEKTFVITQISGKQINQEIFIDNSNVFKVDYVQSADTPPQIDILMVIDNSGSMWEEQTNLSTKLNVLLKNLAHTDWQINVITTDNPCPTQSYLPISPKTENVEERYREAITVGTWGSAWETGQQMLVEHLKGPKGCAGGASWLRKNAKFAVILVSDETEDSTSDVTPDDVVDAFKEIGYKPGETVKFYGFIWHPSVPKERCPSAFEPPAAPHAELVEKTGGLWGSVCAADYSETLGEISKDIGQLVKVLIPLGKEPALSTVKVVYNGQVMDQGWMISGKNLVLRYILKPEDSISVEFQEKEAKAVSLETTPVPGSLHIYFNNKEISADLYVYNEGENTVHFLDNLPPDTKIKISYQEKIILKSSFDFPHLDLGIVECYNQNDRLDVLYFKESSELIFLIPPPEGSLTTCYYQ